MTTEVSSFESTPNPNAVKCLLSAAALPQGAPNVSVRTRADAAAHPLAAALCALDGVTGVLITPMWFTVSKSPDAEWKSLKPKIKRVVGEYGKTLAGGGAG